MFKVGDVVRLRPEDRPDYEWIFEDTLSFDEVYTVEAVGPGGNDDMHTTIRVYVNEEISDWIDAEWFENVPATAV